MSDWEAVLGGSLTALFNVVLIKVLAPEAPDWAVIMYAVTLAYIIVSEWRLQDRLDKLLDKKR